MRIAVFGNFGVDNRGDDMILQGLMKQFSGDELVVFCGNPQHVQKLFGIEAHRFFPGGMRSIVNALVFQNHRKRIKESTEALQSVDRVLIGGGGILVDRRIKAVSLWFAQLKRISESKKPYEFIANSFELSRKWSQKLFTPFLKGAENISVRDTSSLRFIESLGLKAELVADLAYQAALPKTSTKKMKMIGLALCRWELNESLLVALRSFMEQKETRGYKFVAFAFQSKGDDDREVYKKLNPRLRVITEWKDIVLKLSECECLIGMRLHSLILADRLRIPSIALSYQDKVKHFMNDKGRDDLVLDMNSVNEQKLQDLFLKAVAGEKK